MAILTTMTLVVVWIIAARLIKTPSPHVDTVLENGEHLVAVLILGSETPDEQLSASMRAAVVAMRAKAAKSGAFFSTIGISADFDVSRGLESIRRVDPVDEKIVGRGWLNSGLQAYVSEREAHQSMPQIVLFRDSVRASPAPLRVLKSYEVVRVSGRDEIIRWVRAQQPPRRSR